MDFGGVILSYLLNLKTLEVWRILDVLAPNDPGPGKSLSSQSVLFGTSCFKAVHLSHRVGSMGLVYLVCLSTFTINIDQNVGNLKYIKIYQSLGYIFNSSVEIPFAEVSTNHGLNSTDTPSCARCPVFKF